MGSSLVPFERALVSSYWPSIVTFPLSLRVSEILPLLCFSIQVFPKISPCSPGSRWMASGLRRAKVLG